MIKKLCSLDNEQNLVQIFHHESYADGSVSDIYQIDMELCIKNLRHEINADTSSLLDILTQISAESAPNNELKDLLTKTSKRILEILCDILRGLEFIHLNNEVHRDLKPENGSWFYLEFLIASSVFLYSPTVENCRFWHSIGGSDKMLIAHNFASRD